MKIKEREEIISYGDSVKEITMQLDTTNDMVLVTMMSALIAQYKNPMGSTIRELSANIVDAHKERERIIRIIEGTGSDEDIQTQESISELTGEDINIIYKYLDKTGKNGEIEFIEDKLSTDMLIFRDYGKGMSEEFITNIYSNLGISTKRYSNQEIGGWGVGSKAVLGYADVYYITSYYNGVQQTFEISNTTKLPKIKIYETIPTDRCSGCEIKIPLKNSTSYIDVQRDINNYLPYISGINFKGFAQSFTQLSKDYEDDDCIISMNATHEMSLLVGNISYPLSYYDIGINSSNVPLALKFNIGDLRLPVHRDSITYDADTIKVIKDKLKVIN
jgi:hypothetical protein